MMERATEQLAVQQEEAARILNLSVRTVRRLTAAGEIPHKRIACNSVVYPVEALKAWLSGKPNGIS